MGGSTMADIVVSVATVVVNGALSFVGCILLNMEGDQTLSGLLHFHTISQRFGLLAVTHRNVSSPIV